MREEGAGGRLPLRTIARLDRSAGSRSVRASASQSDSGTTHAAMRGVSVFKLLRWNVVWREKEGREKEGREKEGREKEGREKEGREKERREKDRGGTGLFLLLMKRG